MSNFEESNLYRKLSSDLISSPLDIQSILKYFVKNSYSTGEHLLRLGAIEKHIHFLEKGIVHQYRIPDIEVLTINVAIPGMFFNSFTSYVLSNPSLQQQTAIGEVVTYSIRKETVDELTKTNQAFCYYYMKKQEEIHLERELRSRILQIKSAKERFMKFIELDRKAEYYMNHVSGKIVAQYLNLTAETFSRVKSANYTKAIS